MNKRDLIDAISGRLGDKKTATEAVNAVLDTIQQTVAKGDKVSITGFGVFEKRTRAARMARHPRTGAAVRSVSASGVNSGAEATGSSEASASLMRASCRRARAEMSTTRRS